MTRPFLPLLAALFLLGCADTAPLPIDRFVETWSGRFNDRGTPSHEGEVLLRLTANGPNLAGEFRLEGDRCIPFGNFRGIAEGTEWKGAAIQGESRVELLAQREGDALYGTYTFTQGPCKRDWGSFLGKKR